ncbi:Uncharacterised protein [Bordetella trematum]|nr:Uncharacterised protein [Bordetella trematum]
MLAAADGQIQAALAQLLQHVADFAFVHMENDLQALGGQIFHDARDDEQAGRGGAAYVHQPACALLDLAQLAADGLQIGQHRLGAQVEQLAGRRGHQPASAAIEQPDLQLIFQFAQQDAQRRLGHVQAHRRG